MSEEKKAIRPEFDVHMLNDAVIAARTMAR
jgi:hypothetical protein